MALKEEAGMIIPNKEDINDEAVLNFYKAINESFTNTIANDNVGDFLLDNLKNSSKSIYNKSIKEVKSFEKTFVDVLEAAYPAFSKIIIDPKRSLKYENDIVLVEKAKKINSESIRHLSSHTQFIRDIKDDNVVPSKILTTYAEEELEIYENRMFKTLVNRICKFLEIRIELMKKNIESYQTDEITYNNNVKLGKNDLDVVVSVKYRKQLVDDISITKKLYDRLINLKEAYEGIRLSNFVQSLKNAKDVVPPLLKTNIIMHNPDFKVIYNTWVFLDRYNVLAYDVDIKENDHEDDTDSVLNDFEKIATLAVSDFLYYRSLDGFDFKTFKSKKLKNPKIDKILSRENEYVFKPSIKVLETYVANELLLRQTLAHFSEEYDTNIKNGMSVEISIRQVTKEVLDVLNQMYPTLFKTEDDLSTLSASKSDLIERQKEKVDLIRIVREEKEIDLNKTIKVEKEALDRLYDLEGVDPLERLYDIDLRERKFIHDKRLDEERIKRLNKLQNSLSFRSLIISKNKKRRGLKVDINENLNHDLLPDIDILTLKKIGTLKNKVSIPSSRVKKGNKGIEIVHDLAGSTSDLKLEAINKKEVKKKERKQFDSSYILNISDDKTSVIPVLPKTKKIKVVASKKTLVSKRVLSAEEIKEYEKTHGLIN